MRHLKKNLSTFIVICFSTTSVFPPSYAQTILNLPVPGTVVNMTPAFSPVIMRGITIHPEDALKFDFLIEKGDQALNEADFKKEANKLIKYFLAALTVNEKEMWVNLSPYEKNRIIPEHFGQTEMGRDLLAQDYLLKQLTASLMIPENDLGTEFWTRVHTKAKERFGTEEVPMNTFNKIWIVPEKAFVYEHEKGAVVVKNHLKVMLEEDYLALDANKNSTEHGLGDVKADQLKIISGVQSQVIKEILIPEIEKEVNEGKTFANLRQIFNSVILATWYKQALKESLLGQVYVNQNKLKGVETDDKEANQKIYKQYVEAFQKGVYNLVKEEYDPATQNVIPRKYFSGGVVLPGEENLAKASAAMLGDENPVVRVEAGMEGLGVQGTSAAMTADEQGVNDAQYVERNLSANVIVDQEALKAKVEELLRARYKFVKDQDPQERIEFAIRNLVIKNGTVVFRDASESSSEQIIEKIKRALDSAFVEGRQGELAFLTLKEKADILAAFDVGNIARAKEIIMTRISDQMNKAVLGGGSTRDFQQWSNLESKYTERFKRLENTDGAMTAKTVDRLVLGFFATTALIGTITAGGVGFKFLKETQDPAADLRKIENRLSIRALVPSRLGSVPLGSRFAESIPPTISSAIEQLDNARSKADALNALSSIIENYDPSAEFTTIEAIDKFFKKNPDLANDSQSFGLISELWGRMQLSPEAKTGLAALALAGLFGTAFLSFGFLAVTKDPNANAAMTAEERQGRRDAQHVVDELKGQTVTDETALAKEVFRILGISTPVMDKEGRQAQMAMKYLDIKDGNVVFKDTAMTAEVMLQKLGEVRTFYNKDYIIQSNLGKAMALIESGEYQEAWAVLDEASQNAYDVYNKFLFSNIGASSEAQQVDQMLAQGNLDGVRALLVDKKARGSIYFNQIKTIKQVRMALSDIIEASGGKMLKSVSEDDVLKEALDIVLRYGGEPDRYDPYNIGELTEQINQEYQNRGYSLSADIVQHITKVMALLDVVGRKPVLKAGITVDPKMIEDLRKPKDERARMIEDNRKLIKRSLSPKARVLGSLVKSSVGKRTNIQNLEDAYEIVRLGLAGESFNGNKAQLRVRLSIIFQKKTVDLMLRMIRIENKRIIMNYDEIEKVFLSSVTPLMEKIAQNVRDAMVKVSTQDVETQMLKLKSLMQDPAFAREMAEWLEGAYYRGIGEEAPPFIEPGQEAAKIEKLLINEKIAMNVAGFYALESGLGYILELEKKRQASGGTDILQTPMDVLDAIVNKTLSGDYMFLLARFANATWKASQPFRDISRIGKPNFIPAIGLSDAELEKDFVQIVEAATKLGDKMRGANAAMTAGTQTIKVRLKNLPVKNHAETHKALSSLRDFLLTHPNSIDRESMKILLKKFNEFLRTIDVNNAELIEAGETMESAKLFTDTLLMMSEWNPETVTSYSIVGAYLNGNFLSRQTIFETLAIRRYWKNIKASLKTLTANGATVEVRKSWEDITDTMTEASWIDTNVWTHGYAHVRDRVSLFLIQHQIANLNNVFTTDEIANKLFSEIQAEEIGSFERDLTSQLPFISFKRVNEKRLRAAIEKELFTQYGRSVERLGATNGNSMWKIRQVGDEANASIAETSETDLAMFSQSLRNMSAAVVLALQFLTPTAGYSEIMSEQEFIQRSQELTRVNETNDYTQILPKLKEYIDRLRTTIDELKKTKADPQRLQALTFLLQLSEDTYKKVQDGQIYRQAKEEIEKIHVQLIEAAVLKREGNYADAKAKYDDALTRIRTGIKELTKQRAALARVKVNLENGKEATGEIVLADFQIWEPTALIGSLDTAKLLKEAGKKESANPAMTVDTEDIDAAISSNEKEFFDKDGRLIGTRQKGLDGDVEFFDPDGKLIGSRNKTLYGEIEYFDGGGKLVGTRNKGLYGKIEYFDGNGKEINSGEKGILQIMLHRSKDKSNAAMTAGDLDFPAFIAFQMAVVQTDIVERLETVYGANTETIFLTTMITLEGLFDTERELFDRLMSEVAAHPHSKNLFAEDKPALERLMDIGVIENTGPSYALIEILNAAVDFRQGKASAAMTANDQKYYNQGDWEAYSEKLTQMALEIKTYLNSRASSQEIQEVQFTGQGFLEQLRKTLSVVQEVTYSGQTPAQKKQAEQRISQMINEVEGLMKAYAKKIGIQATQVSIRGIPMSSFASIEWMQEERFAYLRNKASLKELLGKRGLPNKFLKVAIASKVNSLFAIDTHYDGADRNRGSVSISQPDTNSVELEASIWIPRDLNNSSAGKVEYKGKLSIKDPEFRKFLVEIERLAGAVTLASFSDKYPLTKTDAINAQLAKFATRNLKPVEEASAAMTAEEVAQQIAQQNNWPKTAQDKLTELLLEGQFFIKVNDMARDILSLILNEPKAGPRTFEELIPVLLEANRKKAEMTAMTTRQEIKVTAILNELTRNWLGLNSARQVFQYPDNINPAINSMQGRSIEYVLSNLSAILKILESPKGDKVEEIIRKGLKSEVEKVISQIQSLNNDAATTAEEIEKVTKEIIKLLPGSVSIPQYDEGRPVSEDLLTAFAENQNYLDIFNVLGAYIADHPEFADSRDEILGSIQVTLGRKKYTGGYGKDSTHVEWAVEYRYEPKINVVKSEAEVERAARQIIESLPKYVQFGVGGRLNDFGDRWYNLERFITEKGPLSRIIRNYFADNPNLLDRQGQIVTSINVRFSEGHYLGSVADVTGEEYRAEYSFQLSESNEPIAQLEQNEEVNVEEIDENMEAAIRVMRRFSDRIDGSISVAQDVVDLDQLTKAYAEEVGSNEARIREASKYIVFDGRRLRLVNYVPPETKKTVDREALRGIFSTELKADPGKKQRLINDLFWLTHSSHRASHQRLVKGTGEKIKNINSLSESELFERLISEVEFLRNEAAKNSQIYLPGTRMFQEKVAYHTRMADGIEEAIRGLKDKAMAADEVQAMMDQATSLVERIENGNAAEKKAARREFRILKGGLYAALYGALRKSRDSFEDPLVWIRIGMMLKKLLADPSTGFVLTRERSSFDTVMKRFQDLLYTATYSRNPFAVLNAVRELQLFENNFIAAAKKNARKAKRLQDSYVIDSYSMWSLYGSDLGDWKYVISKLQALPADQFQGGVLKFQLTIDEIAAELSSNPEVQDRIKTYLNNVRNGNEDLTAADDIAATKRMYRNSALKLLKLARDLMFDPAMSTDLGQKLDPVTAEQIKFISSMNDIAKDVKKGVKTFVAHDTLKRKLNLNLTDQTTVRHIANQMLKKEIDVSGAGFEVVEVTEMGVWFIKKAVGGIDLNPTIMSTEIQKNGNGVIIPIPPQPIEKFKDIQGITPNIINVYPAMNLRLLLGMKEDGNQKPASERTDVSMNLSMAVDSRKQYAVKEE